MYGPADACSRALHALRAQPCKSVLPQEEAIVAGHTIFWFMNEFAISVTVSIVTGLAIRQRPHCVRGSHSFVLVAEAVVMPSPNRGLKNHRRMALPV